LRFDHRLETFRHRVEVASEVANFVTPLRELSRDARAEVACGKLIRRRSQLE
jgi:hypothetical protein